MDVGLARRTATPTAYPTSGWQNLAYPTSGWQNGHGQPLKNLAAVRITRTSPRNGSCHPWGDVGAKLGVESIRLTLFWIFLARVAYFRDMSVSSRLELAGEQFTNISVFALPPKTSCISSVSLWFL